MAPGMDAKGPISKNDPRFRPFETPTLYDGVTSVKVDLGTEDDSDEEEVEIDPERGPLLWRPDAPPTSTRIINEPCRQGDVLMVKNWVQMSVTEQTTMIHVVAKKNRAAKNLASR
mmetsp:Transcript_14706/g.29877  ORF Transcript_14706/g.29877 Transcript_14706/m.29877 type:complete len:115 (-) Transcript_14706:134-478(-)